MMQFLRNLFRTDHVTMNETEVYMRNEMERMALLYNAKEEIFAYMLSDAEELIHAAGLYAESFELMEEDTEQFLRWPLDSYMLPLKLSFHAENEDYQYKVCCTAEVYGDEVSYRESLYRTPLESEEKEEFDQETATWKNLFYTLENKIISFLQYENCGISIAK